MRSMRIGARRLREDAARGGTLAVVEEVSAAAYRFLGATPSTLLVVAIEDVLGEAGGVNVPGTFDEHPNWRRKRSLSLEQIEADGRLMRIAADIDQYDESRRDGGRRRLTTSSADIEPPQAAGAGGE